MLGAKAAAYMVIEVKFESRDGYLHVTSEQVPGLYLCGTDPRVVIDDIIPAIKRFSSTIEVGISRLCQKPSLASSPLRARNLTFRSRAK
jgi:hypothetical protein